MSIVARYDLRSTPPAEKYDETLNGLKASGDFPPEGLEYHVAFLADGGIRISEIWDSREQFEALSERLKEVLVDIGIEPGEPEVFEVHHIIRR
jgi:hypothetical protein